MRFSTNHTKDIMAIASKETRCVSYASKLKVEMDKIVYTNGLYLVEAHKDWRTDKEVPPGMLADENYPDYTKVFPESGEPVNVSRMVMIAGMVKTDGKKPVFINESGEISKDTGYNLDFVRNVLMFIDPEEATKKDGILTLKDKSGRRALLIEAMQH